MHIVSKMIGEQERTLQETFGSSTDSDDRFYANILKMEVERAKFVLKSYLRTRIAKIERHLLWVVEKDQSSLLSAAEMNFAFSLYESRKTHLADNLFSKIPKKLNFTAEQPAMADQYSKFVFSFSPCTEYKRNGVLQSPDEFRRVVSCASTHFSSAAQGRRLLSPLRRHQVSWVSNFRELLRKGQIELL